MIRTRLTILVPAIVWLALASLNSAISHFAIILRDNAESDLINTNHALLDLAFKILMERIIVVSVIVALVSASLSIFGTVLAIHPRWLHQDCKYRFYFEYLQVMVGLISLSVGGYIAGCVHGSQSWFELLDRHDHLPYYGIIYYGAVGQASFGSLVITVSFFRFIICDFCGH
ncbi:hypothetical protein N7466_001477 [Penicillium verhagenii]|uniref:uncharacterized protein n=1 Tax=Penicillium verhagenii TaxID=1562060 RepID=UPI00254599AF|nr:uncharacterized protein N7466_001477 [Penicillium verhagenii]KAJ5938343.1 hypothetical protein N7466_001477 [Penicillium verhagenii]